MPRGNLNETTVQKIAVRWLEERYRHQAGVRATASELEVRVKPCNKTSFGRADGLVAFRLENGQIHVASLEAKSARTLRNIAYGYDDGRWLWHTLGVAIVAAALTVLFGWSHLGLVWRWIAPIGIFLAAALVYMVVSYNFPAYRVVDAVDQVQRYPANEKWVALSADAFNQLKPGQREHLQRDCRSKKIGLLSVANYRSVRAVLQPGFQPTPPNLSHYLDCYHRGPRILANLVVGEDIPGRSNPD